MCPFEYEEKPYQILKKTQEMQSTIWWKLKSTGVFKQTMK